MSKIAILVPTRGRPRNMERLVRSMNSTTSNIENVELWFYIDDDDETSVQKATELTENNKNVFAIVGPQTILSNTFNILVPHISLEVDIFLPQGDDSIFVTQDWDLLAIEYFKITFPDKIVYYYVDDISAFDPDKTFGSSGFLHRNFYDTLGYLLPPYFTAEWGDTWLNEIVRPLNRGIFSKIIVEHLHHLFGKSSWDETYHLQQIRRERDKPNLLFYSDEMVQKRKEDTEKLQNFINNFK